MTHVTGEWRTNPKTQAVCAALAEFDLYFVGGCVRNALIGAPVADIDLSTNARPDAVTNAAEAAGLKVIPTGIDHGTVTVVSGGIPHEITTFRKDVATDGRRATVAFADTITDDALRRDFTMNALYATPDGTLVDPLGGLPDLQARRVRFIEDADQRIKEDYLRILRFFRFHAWYGDASQGLDADGLAACAANIEGLARLSKERIGAETLKLLAAPDPAPSVAAMAACGALGQILPGANHEFLAPLIHLEGTNQPRALRRLACVGGQDLPSNLRLSKQDAAQLTQIRNGAVDGEKPSVLAYRFGAQIAFDATLVRCALTHKELPLDLDQQIAAGTQAEFPVKAADLMPKLSGAALGKTLAKLENQWIEADFKLSKQQLLR